MPLRGLVRAENGLVGQIYEGFVATASAGRRSAAAPARRVCRGPRRGGHRQAHRRREPEPEDGGDRSRPVLRAHDGGRRADGHRDCDVRTVTMYPVLTASTFLPSVGAAAHLLVSSAAGAVDCAGDDDRHAGGFGSALSALRQDLERSAVCRKPAMDSVLERGLRHGRRRHQPAVHLPLGSGQRAVCRARRGLRFRSACGSSTPRCSLPRPR